MDKKSNRTDLLAAGRKRLQQYRQKKDGKGKDGKGKPAKSTSKSASEAENSEQHDDDDSLVQASVDAPVQASVDAPVQASVDAPVESLQLAGREPDPDLSASVSSKSTEDSALNEPGNSPISAHSLDDKGTREISVDLAVEDSEVKETSSSSDNHCPTVPEELQKLQIDLSHSKGAVSYGIPASDADIAESSPVTSSSAPLVSADEDGASATVELDVLKREDQVSSDVGAMQEVHCSGPEDCDRSTKLEQREEANLSVPVADEGVEPLAFPGGAPGILSALEQYDNLKAGDYTPYIAADGGNGMKEACTSLSSSADGQSVNIVNLVDVIKGLSEDDFAFLVNSRSLPNSYADALSESLYLANTSKELFHVQLLEASEHESYLLHQNKQFVDKISVLTTSLADADQRNRITEAEFAQIRSELKAAIFQKEELQSQSDLADSEVKKLSSEIDELVKIVEESSRGFSKLSEELDGCKLQLADSQAENKRLVNTLASFTDQNKEIELRDQLLDERKTELAGCWSTITALQVEIATLNINLAFVTDEKVKVEEENHFLSAKNEKLSVDLADCRSMLDALEEQRSSLSVNLAELQERRGMIEEWNENLVSENERLAHEASSHKQSLSEEHDRCVQLEDDLKQARLNLEQLMEENIALSCTMETYKSKIAQISDKHSISSSQQMGVGVQLPGHASLADADYLQTSAIEPVTNALSSVLFKSSSGDHKEDMLVNNLKGGVYDDSLGFPTLIRHLEEAERLLLDLNKAIGGMNSHSLPISHSLGKSAEPEVSKLIQAFEPSAPPNENESEASEPTGGDLYLSAKHHIGNLGILLKTMYQDILHAGNLVKVEKEGCQSAHPSHQDLVVEAESWEDLCVNRELHNVRVEVQLEVLKQHMHSMDVKQIELETSYEALKEEEASLRTKNSQLGEKMNDYLSRTSKLFVQLDEFGKSSREVSSSVHADLEDLRNDVMEKACKLEGALLSSTATAAQVVSKLNNAVGSPFMQPSQASSVDEVDIDSQMLTSANAACQMIEDLKEKLQTVSRENETLSGRHEEMTKKLDALVGENKSAVELLEKISADLLNCFNRPVGVKESEIQLEAKLCDALDASHFETIMKKLSSLLNERQQLKESNDKHNRELVNSTNAVEELKEGSSDSNLLLKLVGDIRDVFKLPPADLNPNESSLGLLQSLFPLLVEKYKEADDSVRFVRDDLNSRMMELRELQECVEPLNLLNLQQQNEILVLMESLKQAKDAFDAIQDELLVKVTEFEHSEQRFASVREKLSIAVAKGKGLIVQRDNLKQSLSETSMELERCSQELQLKELRLKEVEDKLKAYSEAGERVEALESELSYIRNSATALRESFLLKDSVLQRIEEILEDLELPEHFHSRDTVEKVDYLAKSVASNSSIAADVDQRSSAVGGSLYPDAGTVITDSWKDDAQHSSNLIEDLRRQYDELQNRFYALAEQNEMLEQSLIERNNLVQRWEGVLDRIDTPVQIRSMEPDERIQWLGTALSEADHHMSSLQQKVDNLESYCGSISADLEEAQRRISELEFSLQTVTYERNNLEQSSLEQNNLVQRWEEVLDSINIPATVRPMEPVERIEWLGTALSEADRRLKSLQQEFDSLETYCDSLTANLDESRKVAAELQSSLQAANGEKETLSRDLAALISERDKSLEENSQFKREVDGLKSEVDTLREKLVEKHEIERHVLQIENEMLRWRDLIVESLQSCGTESLIPDGSNPCESLEFLIQRLVGEYMRFSKQIHDESRARDALAEEVQSSIDLRRELDVAISELEHLKEEKETLSRDLAALISERDKSIEENSQFKRDVDGLKSEVDTLREKLVEKHEIDKHVLQIENEMLRWRDLIVESLQSCGTESLIPDGSNPCESLEFLIQRLVGEYMRFSKQIHDESRARDALAEEVRSSIDLRRELDVAICELEHLKKEKETLSRDLAALVSERDKSLEENSQFKRDVDGLKSEMDTLREKLVEKHETDKHVLQIENEMLRWRDLIVESLQSCGTESLIPDGSNPCESLEFLIQRLVGEYVRFSKQIHDESRARDALAEEVQSSIDLRRELDVAISELEHLKEERDVYMKSQSSVSELEELEKKKVELQNLLKQEDQKSASLREKLNVAVRRGKSLVQHRDALKQSIEDCTAEIGRLKSEINMREASIVVFEQKIEDLSSQLVSSHALQSENVSLRNQLTETTQHLHDTEHTLSLITQKLSEIDVNSDLDISNPVQKLEEIQKLCANMHGAVISSEQETKKAKRASELLLAELNEVQERNDTMQEDLAKAYKEISDMSKQKDIAESAKLQVLSRLQDLVEESRNQRAEYDLFKSSVSKLERSFFGVSDVIANAFAKDVDLLHRLRANMQSYAKVLGSDLQLTGASSGVPVSSKKEGYQATYSFQGPEAANQSDGVGFNLSQLTRNVELFKEQIYSDSLCLQDEAEMLLNFIDNLHSEVASLKTSSESMKAEFLHLESTGKKRDMDCAIMRQGISLLYEACCSSIMEIESRKAQVVGSNLQSEEMGSKLKALPFADGGLNLTEEDLLTSAENARSLGDRLLLSVTDFITMHARSMEGDQKEMRATTSNLQKELQEKDIQKERMCMELVSQIKVAEAAATGYSRDLQTAKVQLHDVQRRMQLMEEERNMMENRITDLQKKQVDSVELQDKISSLAGVTAAKEQEIEVLMQALDEEENQMEGFKARIEELELDVKKKNVDLEQALATRAKATKKLSITVNKFDELHHMSEGLLSEVENLQNQLQDRESEISFLRLEVTRCTKDVLLASKTVKERSANELQDFLTWLETQFSQFVMQEVHDDNHNDPSIEYKDRIQKLITSVMSELEELRAATQRKDASLQLERKKVEELSHAKEELEASLCERESHLSSLLNGGDTGQSTSEIVEVESVINKWVAPTTSTASQVRSLRKSNNEQVAIAIDADTTDSGRLEDEDDDKVHGFKSLTTSRFVPKFTRPVSDMIDGLWVSCDRALMRQPGLRLGIMIYWAIMHALLATFVV